MQFFKRQLPILLAFCVGLVLWAQYYSPSSLAQNLQQSFTAWAIILTGAALILGILSAIHHHWSKVSTQKPGYGYSLITLFCFSFVVLAGWFPSEPIAFGLLSRQYFISAVFVILGIILTVRYIPSVKANRASANHALGIMAALFFDWVFQNMFVPLDATMFSLLAFYIASAAFRAFRARSFEATALLISGCIVMIGRVPLGEQLSFAIAGTDISFASVASWILNNPNAAAQRGILLGVLLSMVAISLRIIFGIERTYMGGAD